MLSQTGHGWKYDACTVYAGKLRLKTHTQNMQYLLPRQGYSFCISASECYFIHTLSVLLTTICITMIYIYIYIYIYTNIFSVLYISECTYTYLCVYIYIYTHINTYIHTYIHAHHFNSTFIPTQPQRNTAGFWLF